MSAKSRAPPLPGYLHATALGQECQQIPLQRPETLGTWPEGTRYRRITCIPEAVRTDIQELVEQLDTFLGRRMEENMISVNFQARVSQLVAAGHILLPTTLTDVAVYLGTLDTSGLL